jgi:transposase
MYMGIERCFESKKPRKTYSREFKLETVGLITEKENSIAEAHRNLGVEYSVLHRWKKQLENDPKNAYPGKGKEKAADEQIKILRRKLERVLEERDIKKALGYFEEDPKSNFDSFLPTDRRSM